MLENFGTNKNMHNAQMIPMIAKKGILLSPKYCAIADDNNGPIAKPKEPQAINVPIFLTVSVVENFTTKPKDCG